MQFLCFIVQKLIIYLAFIVFVGIILLLCSGELCPLYYLFRKIVCNDLLVAVYFAARNKKDVIEGFFYWTVCNFF